MNFSIYPIKYLFLSNIFNERIKSYRNISLWAKKKKNICSTIFVFFSKLWNVITCNKSYISTRTEKRARWLENFSYFNNCVMLLYWVDIYVAVGCVINETFLVGECLSFVIVRFLQTICIVVFQPFPLVALFYQNNVKL